MMKLLCVLKCLIDGTTYHLLFYQERRKEDSLRENVKNIGIFLVLLLVIIGPASLLFPEEMLSVLTVIFCMVCFYYRSKRTKNLLVIILSLLFFHLILLFINFIATVVAGIIMRNNQSSKIYDLIVVSVYLIFCVALVCSKFIIMKIIKKMMDTKEVIFLIAFLWLSIVSIYFYFKFRPMDYGSRIILIPIMFLGLFLIFYMIKLAYEIHEKHNARIEALQQVKGKSLDELRNENTKIWDALYEYFSVDLQISSGMKGFNQLMLAVLFVIVGGQKSYNLLRDIYPRVAELTGATRTKSVAVNITNVIQSIWGNAENAEHLAEVYPYPVSSKTGMPTNKEFIFCVADRMKKQLNLKKSSEKVEVVGIF